MTRYRRGSLVAGEEGFAVVYMACILTGMLLFTGLAVDSGRGYVVKAQLSKAVDGAALGAARALNSGNPRAEAVAIFKANFPPGYFGTDVSPDPTAASDFFSLTTDRDHRRQHRHRDGHVVAAHDVHEAGELPGAEREEHRRSDAAHGRSVARARRVQLDRRPVGRGQGRDPDLRQLVRREQRSLSPDAVRKRRRASWKPCAPAAGSSRPTSSTDVPNTLPGGSTNMVEGLYRGWDEIRSVPNGQQSGLRVIVLFTDGASNSVPGIYPGNAAPRSLRTYDFPDNGADPDNQTHARPNIAGLYDPGVVSGPGTQSLQGPSWNSPCGVMATPHNATQGCLTAVPLLPVGTESQHNTHRSSGIPTNFPLQTAALNVNGTAQNSPSRRGLRDLRPEAATLPTSGTSTTRRGTSSRSSPTQCGAMPAATTRSGSTRSAWASWCGTTSGPWKRRPRAS